eukprot:225378-Amphidinium_carterae.1
MPTQDRECERGIIFILRSHFGSRSQMLGDFHLVPTCYCRLPKPSPPHEAPEKYPAHLHTLANPPAS